MKPTTAQQQALLGLLGRIYEEIRVIEETYHIRGHDEDYRPRIDYFHDAVRAFTQSNSDGFERVGRLSVESLAEDAVMLRQLKENPLLKHPELNIPLSPHTDIANLPQMPIPHSNKRIDVSVASRLAEGYGHYALLFVALLSHPAERNFMNRVNECQDQQEKILDLIAEAKTHPHESQVNEHSFLAGITDPELRRIIMAAIAASKKSRHATAREILNALQHAKEEVRKTVAALETTHMRFASSQLVLYQDAQRIVKKMAAQGLNIVGEFVEQAVREAERGGRGF